MADAPVMPPVPEDDGAIFTRWLVIGAVVFIVAVSVVAYFGHWPWLSNLWFNYAWPSDKGNGPEAIQQTLLYALVAILVIPPVRRAFLRHVHSVETRITIAHEAEKAHHEEAKAHREEMHATIKAIHEHVTQNLIPPPSNRGPKRDPKTGRYTRSDAHLS